MEIAPGTDMNPDALAFLWREPPKREAIQVNETVKELPTGSLGRAAIGFPFILAALKYLFC